MSTRTWVYKLSSTQPAIKCSKLTIETLEQGVKYVQSVFSGLGVPIDGFTWLSHSL